MGEAAFVLPPQSQREEEGARKESLCSPVEGGGEEEATEEDGGDRRGRRASLKGSGRGERARMIGGGFLPFAGELRAYVRTGAGGGERTGYGLRATGCGLAGRQRRSASALYFSHIVRPSMTAVHSTNPFPRQAPPATIHNYQSQPPPRPHHSLASLYPQCLPPTTFTTPRGLVGDVPTMQVPSSPAFANIIASASRHTNVPRAHAHRL